MAETEDIMRSCKCNVDLVEGVLTINGSKVRFYKCPECGAFTYHQGDIQKAVYGEHKGGLSDSTKRKL